MLRVPPLTFFKVASQEAPWVQPSDQTFSYELKAARAYHAHHALASPLAASPTHYASEIPDGLPRAAHGGYPPTTAGYSYGAGKYYPSVPSWTSQATYPAEDGTGVDYGAMGYSYPYHSQDPSYFYRMTAAKTSPNAELYVNTDGTGYGYGSSGAALVHRPATAAVSPDAPNFSLSNVAASLPHAGGDRLLPNPSRLPGTTNVLSCRPDASAPSYATSTSSKSSGSASSNPSPTSAVSEVTTSYETSSVSGYPPPSHTLPSMTHAHHRNDVSAYPPSSSGESIFTPSENSLRSHGSASDMSYKYSDSSSTGSGRRGSDETSSSGGSLSNGQTYTVTTPSSAMYAASMAQGRHHHVGAYALMSEDCEQHPHPHQHHQHPSGRRSAASLSAS